MIVVMQENRSFDSYFGTYPRSGWHPDAARPADRLRPEQDRRLREALPRRGRPGRRRPARLARRATRRRRRARWTGSSRSAPDCFSGPIGCYTKPRVPNAPGFWNVLPALTDVRQDGETAAADRPIGAFFADAARGALPAVSWVTPDFEDSEHPLDP